MKKFAISLLAGAAALGMVSATYAADLVVEEPVVDYPVIQESIWDGGYIGVFAGFGWANVDHDPFDPFDDDDDFELCFDVDCDFDMNGWLLGLTAGYNFALNGGGGAVIGIAGDIAWADLSGDNDFFVDEFGDMDRHSNVNFEGSLRGVLGWDGGVWMPYLTAGVSFLGVNHRFDMLEDEFDALDVDGTHVGGTAGIGVAYAVAENLSLDLQWRASWYDKDEFHFDAFDFDPSIGLVTNRITAGLNWNF